MNHTEAWSKNLEHSLHKKVREKSQNEQSILLPQMGSGTFEEIMALVQSFTPFEMKETLLEVVAENRAIR